MLICNAILIADYREMILHTVWHARDASWSMAAAAACMLAASLYEMLWRCHAVICTLAYVCLRSHKRYLQGKDSKYLASMYTYRSSASTRCLCIRFNAGVVYRHTFDLA